MRWLADREGDGGNRRPGVGLPPDLSESVKRYAIVVAVCFLFASMLQPPVVAAAFSAMMTFAALVAVVTALVRGEEVALAAINHWDEAALFLLTSVVARWFVDMEALRAAASSAGAG